MDTVLVTGSGGFIGKHIVEALRRRPDTRVLTYDRSSKDFQLDAALSEAGAIIHLAGVNRPRDEAEFHSGNGGLTQDLCARLEKCDRRPRFVLSSSIQAGADSAYGRSKLAAEAVVEAWARHVGAPAIIFRLQNVFGKWSRPNYNSVTATFCHNIARDLPITISDPNRELGLVYIDDVVAALLACVGDPAVVPGCHVREVAPVYRITLGELAARIRSFRESRRTLLLPALDDAFTHRLYATYLSYLAPDNFGYRLEQRTDPRGSLAEFVKSTQSGQIFLSRTKPGITRGNHYHHTKTEKFLVVEGEGMVRFRPITGGEILEYRVNGTQFIVIDIPPGYAHSIENVGPGDLVTLFWASEIFDPLRPDVYGQNVLGGTNL